MSLLVDPEAPVWPGTRRGGVEAELAGGYFLHVLKLNYLRRIPDPCGPCSISFSPHHLPSSQPSAEPHPGFHQAGLQANPYIQLSGLADSQRWPELMVSGSPPESSQAPFNVDPSKEHGFIRGRRRRGFDADAGNPRQAPNPSGSTLKYSETIVGPQGGGRGAGMRVSGRKSFRASRRGLRNTLAAAKLGGPLQAGKAATDTPSVVVPTSHAPNPVPQYTNAAAHALALAEGRARVVPGGGLNPEDSDDNVKAQQPTPTKALFPPSLSGPAQDLDVKSHSRTVTIDTVKEHRRRVSAVTFSNQAIVLDGSTIISTPRTRPSRVHSVSSVTTANSILSSDMSDNSAQVIHGRRSIHRLQRSTLAFIADDRLEAENTAQSPPPPVRRRPRLDSKNNTGVYYLAEHDPDKRLSDMLFSFTPRKAHRRTQIVGSVGLEPAPLLEKIEQNGDVDDDEGGDVAYEEEEEDDDDDDDEMPDDDDDDAATDHTDPGLDIADDDSSSHLDDIDEDAQSNTLSTQLRGLRRRRQRETGSDGVRSVDLVNAGDSGSIGKSLSNTLAMFIMDPTPLGKSNGHPADVTAAFEAAKPNGLTSSSPPVVRRRERRRVNIKMGSILGPPVIDEETTISHPPIASGQRPTTTNISGVPPLNRARFVAAQPSLPDLRAVVQESQQGPANLSDDEKSVSAKNVHPPRPRSLTSPTITPIIAVGSDPVSINSQSNLLNGAARHRNIRTAGQPFSGEKDTDFSSATPRPNRPSQIIRPMGGGDLAGVGGTSHSPVNAPAALKATVPPKVRPKKTQLVFKKVDVTPSATITAQPKPKSILTELLNAKSPTSLSDNPFRCFYALLASKERNALKVSIYYPFSNEPSKPIKTSIRSDICVEEVVGFGLWIYVEEGREPKLGELKSKELDLTETQSWCLRLVEDDGEVDEDFPALERTRPAGKVGSQDFAIVMATAEQAKQNVVAQSQIQRRPSRVLGEPKRAVATGPGEVLALGGGTSLLPPPINAMTGMSGASNDGWRSMTGGTSAPLFGSGYGPMSFGGSLLAVAPVFLKIRIPSPGRGVDSIITTLNVTIDMYLADVLETLCKRKSLGDAKEWALLVPSSPSIPVHQRDIIVPLDRTVQSLQGVTSLALVKRSQVSSKLLRNSQLNGNLTSQNTNPSASIFKRLSEPPQPKYVSITDLTSTNRTFVVQTKRRGILGKHEKLLTIEDDYVHISPNIGSHHSNYGASSLSSGKTSSYHISQIVSCATRTQVGLKLVVMRESGEKRYDVEAESAQSAVEIVRHIKGLKEMYHTRN